MNNYCHNCGKKLDSGEFICRNCKMPRSGSSSFYNNYSATNNENTRNKIFIIALLLVVMVYGISVWANNSYKNKYNVEHENIIEEIDRMDIDNSTEKIDDDSYDKPDSVTSVFNYPYEGDFHVYPSDSWDNRIYLDNNGTFISFFSGMLYDGSKIHVSGDIENPIGYIGNVNLVIKYYDKEFTEIGSCIENVPLLGPDYEASSFSCHIAEDDLINNKKFSDVALYQVNISSIEIN